MMAGKKAAKPKKKKKAAKKTAAKKKAKKKAKPRKSAPAKRRGRPFTFNEEIFDQVIAEIATTAKGLNAILDGRKKKRRPSVSHETFYRWLLGEGLPFEGKAAAIMGGEMAERYARAREAQQDFCADEIIDIADGVKVGQHKQHIEKAKVRIDARKWRASKLHPRKYGDKTQITGADDGPIIFQPIQYGKKGKKG